MPLLEFTNKGLYCPQANFYIDPWKPVDFAVISHGHSDHAKWGSKKYLCHHDTKPILALRLGENEYHSVRWNEPVFMNGVSISLFPVRKKRLSDFTEYAVFSFFSKGLKFQISPSI